MPSGWDPPKLEVQTAAESDFTSATSYIPGSGKIITPNGNRECILGIDSNGTLGILTLDFGTAGQDNLPRVRLTSCQFWDAVDTINESKTAEITLTPDSLVIG